MGERHGEGRERGGKAGSSGEAGSSGAAGASGTAGGADLEPLRGGMNELDEGRLGPGHASEHGGAERGEPEHRGSERAATEDPPAPYHATAIPEGGLTPRATPGAPSAPSPGQQSRGAQAHPSRGEIEATADEKIAQERSDHENEAANARRDPSQRGHDE